MKDGESKYAYKKKSAWEQFSKQQITTAYAFAEGYKTFLNDAKTEREAIRRIAEASKKQKKKSSSTKKKQRRSSSKEKNLSATGCAS